MPREGAIIFDPPRAPQYDPKDNGESHTFA
jgi:hypothetical protein